MHHLVAVVALVAVIACNKDKSSPAGTGAGSSGSSTGPAAPAGSGGGSGAIAPSPTPAPPPPAREPVALSADQINPTCDKIFTTEVVGKTHGASSVKTEPAASKGLIICTFMKGEESVGSVTLACTPDLDPTAIERERAAMTKAKDLATPVGRGGYRISNSVVLIDDETPCRAMVNYMSFPADDAALTESLRALIAAISPETLK